MINTVPLIFILFVVILSKNAKPQISFGVFADCQYCDCETLNNRFYRNSLQKLEKAIRHFNQTQELEFVVNLGDLIDRDIASFYPLMPVLAKSEKQIFHVIGNHDLEVENEHLSKIPSVLGMTSRYYAFEKKGWLFVFLEGNDLTFLSDNQEVVEKARILTSKLKADGKPNYHEWNGGLGKAQINWLDKQLTLAKKSGFKVAIFCHYPLMPLESHTLWNQSEVLSILEKYSCVKLWMNGHNHAGGYVFYHGIHFITLKGMVETETENAFSEVLFSGKSIKIKGFGREVNRKLVIH